MVAGPGRLLEIKQLSLQLGGNASAPASGGSSVSPNLSVTMTIYAFDTAISGPAAGGTTTAPTQPATSETSSSGL